MENIIKPLSYFKEKYNLSSDTCVINFKTQKHNQGDLINLMRTCISIEEYIKLKSSKEFMKDLPNLSFSWILNVNLNEAEIKCDTFVKKGDMKKDYKNIHFNLEMMFVRFLEICKLDSVFLTNNMISASKKDKLLFENKLLVSEPNLLQNSFNIHAKTPQTLLSIFLSLIEKFVQNFNIEVKLTINQNKIEEFTKNTSYVPSNLVSWNKMSHN